MYANHSPGQSLVERVARFVDLDTRRVLGVPPGRLPKSDFTEALGPNYFQVLS